MNKQQQEVNKIFSQDYRDLLSNKVLTKWYQEPISLSV